MSRRPALLVSFAAIVAAGCGGSHHAATTNTSTASSAATAPAAAPAPAGIRGRLLTTNELPGFKAAGVTVYETPSSWISAEQGLPAQQLAAEKRMLVRDGFRGAARENLTSGSTPGLSEVEQLRSPAAARDAFALYASQFKSPAPSAGAYAPFKVSGIPGAVGFSLGGAGGGINIAFIRGPYYYLVGQIGGSKATIANLTAAAQHLYARVH